MGCSTARRGNIVPGVKRKTLPIGSNLLGGRELVFVLGPCVIESEDFAWRMARELKRICSALGAQFVFKASYDKANRSSIKSFRGVDAQNGCALLSAIGRDLQVPVTTDVHSPAEAQLAAQFVDILQIPAFLCRQTDLIKAAAETGKIVNVKKGQFLAPWDVRNIADKLIAFGNETFFLLSAAPPLATIISSLTCAHFTGCATLVSTSSLMQLILFSGQAARGRRHAETEKWRRFSRARRWPPDVTAFLSKPTRIPTKLFPMDRTRFRWKKFRRYSNN
jgi:hypothetical protein